MADRPGGGRPFTVAGYAAMPDTIDTPFARRFLRRPHDAVNAHDAVAVALPCHDDIVWQAPAAPHTLHGHDTVRAFHRNVMFPALPDARDELLDGPFLAAYGTGVAVRLRIGGTMNGPLSPPGFAPTGERLSFETAEISRFRDGLLARHTVILDMLDLARQIGAVPRPGTIVGRVGVWMKHVAAFRARVRRTAPD
jgi:predicted ester cyclase